MSNQAEITYRDFWDVPRIFIARHKSKNYLFDCEFDEITEEYPEMYQVYVLPELAPYELEGSWKDLNSKAQTHLGEIAVTSVIFDATSRQSIDVGIIDELRTKLDSSRG